MKYTQIIFICCVIILIIYLLYTLAISFRYNQNINIVQNTNICRKEKEYYYIDEFAKKSNQICKLKKGDPLKYKPTFESNATFFIQYLAQNNHLLNKVTLPTIGETTGLYYHYLKVEDNNDVSDNNMKLSIHREKNKRFEISSDTNKILEPKSSLFGLSYKGNNKNPYHYILSELSDGKKYYFKLEIDETDFSYENPQKSAKLVLTEDRKSVV